MRHSIHDTTLASTCANERNRTPQAAGWGVVEDSRVLREYRITEGLDIA